MNSEFDTESLADTMGSAMREQAPSYYQDPTSYDIYGDMNNAEKLALEIFKNIMDYSENEQVPDLVKKFYEGQYTDFDNGESSLNTLMLGVVLENPMETFDTLVDEATPIVRERIMKRFATNLKNNHPLKNFFRIENFDNEEIVRIKPDGNVVVPTRDGSKDFKEKEDQKWQNYQKTFPEKYKAQHEAMITQAERDKKFWIDALVHHTHIEVVRKKDKLLPFDDMAVVSHTRRGVTKKKHDGLYDGALYGIYLGEYFIDKILQTPN